MSDNGPANKRPRRGRSATATGTSNSKSKELISTKAPNDQSSNSLLYLNDECLQKLFEHLDIESLCQMANVCKRFRKISEQAFSQRYKHFEFKGRSCKNAFLRRVLCKFGHLIISINASQAHFDGNEKIDVDAIVKYCQNNLEKLILNRATINCNVVKPLFSRLKYLDLSMCEFIGNKMDLFKNCPNLEVFGFEPDFALDFSCDRNRSIGFVAQKFPKLECLAFNCSYIGFLTFFDLLSLNPQVKQIDISAKSEDMYIDAVVKYAKNLEAFAIHSGDSLPEEQTKKGLLKLSELKKLQKLHMEAGSEIYGKLVGPLMDAFAKEKVPINRMELLEFSIQPKDIKSILKMKTIKILCLDEIVQASEADIIQLAKQLPLLENLQLYFGEKVKTPNTVNGIAKMAKDAKLLNYLALVNVQNLKIDKNAFEKILNAVQSRRNDKALTIDIVGKKKTTTLNVPEDIQRAAKKYLTIKYRTQ